MLKKKDNIFYLPNLMKGTQKSVEEELVRQDQN